MGTWTLTLMVLALIAIAVGDELAIAHPATTRRSGSPCSPSAAGSRPLGVAAPAILAIATAPLTLIVGIAAPTAVLVAVAVADTT